MRRRGWAGGEGGGLSTLYLLHPALRPQHGPHLHGAPGGQRWCGEVEVVVGWGSGWWEGWEEREGERRGMRGDHPRYTRCIHHSVFNMAHTFMVHLHDAPGGNKRW